MLIKIDGFLIIPHELMHVLAYRFIGKRCTYRLGDHGVTALEPRTLGERLFCLLFPLSVNLLAVFILLAIWFITYVQAEYPVNPFAYLQVAPLWHRSLFFGWMILLTYAGTATFDVIIAGRLLLEKLRQQPPDKASKDQSKGKRPENSK